MVRSICAMRVLSHDGDATVVVADMSLCNLQHPSLCHHSSSQQPAGPACLHVFAPTCRLGIDSIDKLRSKLGEMRGELQDPHRFQEVYNYSFQWACEVRQGGLAADLLHVPWFGGGAQVSPTGGAACLSVAAAVCLAVAAAVCLAVAAAVCLAVAAAVCLAVAAAVCLAVAAAVCLAVAAVCAWP
jgi:hypothetical protein